MELIRDVRNNGHLLLAKIAVVVLVALAAYSFGTFVVSTEQAVDRSLSDRADVEIATLIDEFGADPEGFERFRRSPERIERLAAFVDRLSEQQGFDFISAFDQPLPLTGFRGDSRFEVGYGTEAAPRGAYEDDAGRRVRDVSSVQMTCDAFAFSGLRVMRGTEPDWHAVRYDDGVVPVVLGADYADVYDLGDELRGSLLFHDLRFTVVGFLEPDSAAYFRGDLDHFLDDTVVVPYPSRLAGLTEIDAGFAGILAFQVLNGDLAIDPDVSSEDLLDRLEALGQQTGFTSWSLTGVPTYLVELAQVRQLVQDNLALLSCILLLLATGAAVTAGFLSILLTRRRDPIWAAHATVGRTPREVVTRAVPLWVAEHAVALSAFVATCAFLPNRHAVPLFVVIGTLLAWMTVDGLAQRRALLAAYAAPRKDAL